jgi:hypothetical protein
MGNSEAYRAKAAHINHNRPKKAQLPQPAAAKWARYADERIPAEVNWISERAEITGQLHTLPNAAGKFRGKRSNAKGKVVNIIQTALWHEP